MSVNKCHQKKIVSTNYLYTQINIMQTLKTKWNSLLILCIIVLTSLQLTSQITWSPPPTGGDTNWHNASNWSTNAVPGPSDDVIIPNETIYPIISSPASAKSIVVDDVNASLTVNNSLTIANSTSFGISNKGDLIVNTNGVISIDNIGTNGIEVIANATLNNSGDINIGIMGGAMNIGRDGLRLFGAFNNFTGGEVHISNTTNAGIAVLTSGSNLYNDGLIETNKNNREGIYSNSTVTNNGTIVIDQTTLDAYYNALGSITNNGTLTIGPIAPVLNGIVNFGVISNTSTGTISIDRATMYGSLNYNSSSFTNDGDLLIATNFSVLGNAVELRQSASFTNNNMTTIGGGGIGQDGIYMYNTATFYNSPCAVIELYDNINNICSNAMAFTNDGYIELSTSETHIPGNFNNGGIINDIQNTFPTGGSGFTNSNIVIAPTLDVFCDLTVIPDAFVYGGSNSYMVDGIFIDANATMTAGTFNPGTNEFTPTSPLTPNSSYTFYVKLSDVNSSCSDVIVAWPVTTSDNIAIAPTTAFCDYSVIPVVVNFNGFNSYMVDGIYNDANATMTAGNYNAATNEFTPTAPLMPNSSYTFYIELYDASAPCPYVIREWQITTTSDVITFDGGGDGTDWHDPLNWDQDIVPTYCHHVIIPPLYSVEVENNSLTAEGKTLDVNEFAGFESLPGALVDIKN